ncbi:hypothetical protein V8E36_002405 [Tilletia maclaganii]
MGRSSAARRSGAGRRSTAASTPAAIPATPTEDNTDAEIGDETQAQLDANEAEDAEAAEGAGGRGDDDEGGEAGDDDDEDEDDEQGEEEVKMIDIDGTEFPQRGDSLILPNDPAGDTKVDDKGRLKGDRAYKFPVFQCPNRADPERLYVLSIDAARSAGYRDSLYFYRNNKRLLKVTLHMSEKEMLIARGRLSMQLRTRNVTATSVLNVYKTHGARVIKAGRAVTDDYYESAARAAGRREGERVRAEGGRERFGGDAELFSGGAGGPVGSLGAGGDYDPSGFAFGPSSTLASIRNKRVDSNVHSFPDPSTGQPVLTVFGDAGLSPWVRIEEGPRAGQTMRRKMLSNMDIDAENWMREAAYMVIGMNRELEDGRKERMTRLLPNGTVRTLTEEGHLLKARMLEEEEDRVAHGGGGSTAAPANGKGKGKNGLGVQVLSGKAEDNVDGGPGGFVATAVLPQGYGPSPSSLPRDKPLVTGPIGVFESLTGIMHVPSSTQPTSARWIRDSEIPTLNKGQAVASLSDGGGGDGRIAGGYLAGTRFGSGAWGLASVSTQLEMGLTANTGASATATSRKQPGPGEAATAHESKAGVHDDNSNEDEDTEDFDMFKEPDTFRPGTPPSTRADWELRIPPSSAAGEDEAIEEPYTIPISITLIGHSPLWGHLLWPASQHLSTYLAEPAYRARFVEGKNVLELGAAAGVPTIACAILGARYVCSTDYPDPDLIRTLEGNVGTWSRREVPYSSGRVDGASSSTTRTTGFVETVGYRWGDDVAEVLDHLARSGGSISDDATAPTYFDTVILSDLIFNHQAHEALLTTCERTTYCPEGWEARWADRRAAIFHDEREEKGVRIDEDGDAIYASMAESSEPILPTSALPSSPTPRSTVLVSFTHHRPVLAHRDLAFFSRARRLGWECAKVGEWACEPVFKDDVGDLRKRSTVHAWAMWRV